MTEPTPPEEIPWAANDGSEPTQPLTAPGAGDWVPPSEFSTPRHAAADPFGPPPVAPAFPAAVPPAPPTQPFTAHPVAAQPFEAAGWAPPTAVLPGYPPPPAAPGRLPGWLWPAVAALALILGVVGGAVGGAAYDRLTATQERAATITEPGPLPADNGSVAAVAEALLPSTVQIVARVDGEDGGATGSGFVLDRAGHVVTNNHVVADSAGSDGVIEIVVQDGSRFEATLVGRSPVYDLAVLYAPQVKDLKPAALGSAEELRVGEGVVAIGSPLGLTATVTSGIVSAVDRPVTTGNTTDDASYINAVQTDAAINPGNSGGPLVNLTGQVVGVNSAIATTGGLSGESGNIGVGFAIPIDQVRITAKQILASGEARYPVIGATVQTRTAARDTEGATIDEVVDGSPAQRAGLRQEDLVTAIDGQRVADGIALIVAIRTHQPGETVMLTLSRDGQEQTVQVTLDSKVG